MGNRSEVRKVLKFRMKKVRKDFEAAMDLFVRMQMMPLMKRWRLAFDLVRQNDLRRAAKNNGMRFGAFRKANGICR